MIADIVRKAASTQAQGDPYYSALSLLLPMDGSNNSTTFTDKSSNNLTVTAYGNAKISTTQFKFGGASGSFDGTNSYLSVPSSALFDFTNYDFTIECWVYFNSVSTVQCVISRSWNRGSSDAVFTLYLDSSTGKLGFDNGNSGILISGTISISANTWYHVAVSRSGSTTRLFVNGVLDASATDTYNYSSSAAVILGNSAVGATLSAYLNGYLDDLRITKYARYTSSFTPPTQAFSNS